MLARYPLDELTIGWGAGRETLDRELDCCMRLLLADILGLLSSDSVRYLEMSIAEIPAIGK